VWVCVWVYVCVGYFDIPVDHIFGEVSGLEAPPCVRVGRFEG
jgi:hypothetical protein